MSANDPDQFNYAVSQTVREVPYNTAGQMPNQQINQLIAFYQYIVTFGQTELWIPDGQRFSSVRYLMKIIKWFAIGVLIVSILFVGTLLAPNSPPLDAENTSHDNRQKLVMKEADKCDCSNSIIGSKLGTTTNDEITTLTIYDEPNVADMFKEISTTEDVDDSTCALYDMFLYVFTKLCSVKDNSIAILSNESQDDIHSTDNGNEKAGQTLATTDDLSLPKTEQNGAVSSEDTHLTNIRISKETNPVNSSEQFHDKDAT